MMNERSEKSKILIVDDQPENIHLLAKNLQDDYEVLYATDGKKALEIAFSDDRPDMILLDIIMPEMDGYEVIRTLKANESVSDIPVIFLTAKTEEEDETRGLESGAWDYITKPFSMPVVRARIQSFLSLKKEMDRRLFLKQQMEFLNARLEEQVQNKTKELQEAREALRANEEKYSVLFEKGNLAEDSAKKLLIVDDRPENIHLLSKNLDDDYEVLYATSGEKALDIAFSDDRPDLILLDVIMPEMDGYEVCSRLKANIGTRDIPVIFLTGMSLAEDETRGLELGAADYISKPFSMPVVRARISAALRLKAEMDKRLTLTRQLQDLNKDLEKRVVEKVEELRLAHEDLKVSESKYRSIFENAVEGIYRATPDGRFLTASPSMARILGYDSPEALVSSVTDIALQCYANPDDRKSFMHMLTKDGVIRGFETRMKKKDASIIWGSISASLICDDQEQGLYIEGFCMDISKQKQGEQALLESEARLRQAQKMEAIGTMAGGIAHDFNNILSPVLGYTEMLADDIPEDSPQQALVSEVLKATLRARELVRQILSFSRQADHENNPVEIRSILKEVLKLSRSTLPATIEIRQDIQDMRGMVMADATRIHQIVMNLITNAFHAMEDEGGILAITLRKADFTSENLPDPKLSPGPYVCLTVADTGIGMDSATREKIFDPYFTTKKLGKGTGLGLSVVHGIVKNYGGGILLGSEPGKGTSVQICLPRIAPEAEDKTEAKDIPVRTGTERILLVDDEEPITNMLRQMAERLGYQVTTHCNSTDALEAFRSAPDNFDIVITDMTMPDMTGDRLLLELKNIRSDIPIILCTGFSGKIANRKASEIGVDRILMKPIAWNDLVNALRNVLDGQK